MITLSVNRIPIKGVILIMDRTKIGLITLILLIVASGLPLVQSGLAGSLPTRQVQYVQRNEPFVYEGFDNPNDYNWQGNWDPRADRNWNNRNDNHDRDIGNSPGATPQCRE
jgi:hypothetical protein